MVSKKEFPLPEKKRQKALSHSIQEGSWGGASVSIGELYTVPFAKEIGASALQIGFLSSLTGLVYPLAQIYGAKMLQTTDRKTMVLRFVFAQALLWIPVILLALAFHVGLLQTAAPVIFIVLYSLVIAFGGLIYPAWFSWMGDLVPAKERGQYFSTRSRTIGLIGLITVLAGAFLIDLFRTRGLLILGFALLFAVACTTRFVSYTFFKKQYVPKIKVSKKDYFSFFEFLRRMDNFGKFAVYLALFNAAIMFASPFFAVYMLDELQFSYVTLMIVSISSSVVYLLALPFAGKFSDRYGNVKLLHLANTLFIIGPLLWIFIRNPFWLIGLPQVTAGIANAAFIIATTNFIYDSVSPRHRALCVTYTNLLAGIGIFFGAALGGIAITYIHISSFSPYLLLFALAACFRLLVALIFLPRVKEVKKVEFIPDLSLEITNPWRALHQDVSWFKHVVK